MSTNPPTDISNPRRIRNLEERVATLEARAALTDEQMIKLYELTNQLAQITATKRTERAG